MYVAGSIRKDLLTEKLGQGDIEVEALVTQTRARRRRRVNLEPLARKKSLGQLSISGLPWTTPSAGARARSWEPR